MYDQPLSDAEAIQHHIENPYLPLVEAMDRADEPQRVRARLEDLFETVIQRDNGDGWFDLIAGSGEGEDFEPALCIRYQHQPQGWYYRIIQFTREDLQASTD